MERLAWPPLYSEGKVQRPVVEIPVVPFAHHDDKVKTVQFQPPGCV